MFELPHGDRLPRGRVGSRGRDPRRRRRRRRRVPTEYMSSRTIQHPYRASPRPPTWAPTPTARAQVLADPGSPAPRLRGDGAASWTNGACSTSTTSRLIVQASPLLLPSSGRANKSLNAPRLRARHGRRPPRQRRGPSNQPRFSAAGHVTTSGSLHAGAPAQARRHGLGSGVYQLVGYVNGVEIGRVNGRLPDGRTGLELLAVRLAPCAGRRSTF